MQLASDIYAMTKNFPKEERYGITAQMRRCCVSIPSNIAEWNERGTLKDFQRFIEIAKGSAVELQVQLEIALRLWYLDDKTMFNKIDTELEEIIKMLSGLLRS